MIEPLTLGILGGGLNSAVGATHFIAAQMDDHFKVESGCFSRHSSVNLETASRWHIERGRVYSDMKSFFSEEAKRLDAVVILTPTPHHLEAVTEALQHGLSVICEKALATSLREAKQIEEVRQRQQGYLSVIYNYSGYPMLRELREMVRQGKLGRVQQIQIEMPQEGFARVSRDGSPMVPQAWRLQDGEIATLSLDLGVHVHHIIDFLTGEKPEELVALQSRHGRFHQVVDNLHCIARYTGSIECSIWYSKAALGHRNGLRVRVFGDQGSAEWLQMDPEFIQFFDQSGRSSTLDRACVDVLLSHLPRYNRFKSGHPAGFLEAFANHYADIADNLRLFKKTGRQEKDDYAFTCQQAIEGLTMLEAMQRSSDKKSWQPVDLER